MNGVTDTFLARAVRLQRFESEIMNAYKRKRASNGSLAGLLDAGEDYTLLAAGDPPTDADLAETIEVKFTEAINAKATELDNNPIKIYEWVRNNVEFVPTYGSIQGADYCLQTMECNAFDTSSLLIALLRASGVHSRYAMGTVEIPINKFMNWVGGFTNTTAAMDFAASGGIPTTGLVEAGKVKVVRLEHVWVEAWVDMVPSMGAKHVTGDTWTPLDASFKQYTYKRGLDLYQDMAINGEQYFMDYITDSTVLEFPAELTEILPDPVISPYQYYNKRLFSVLDAKYPDSGFEEIVGIKEMTEDDVDGDFSTLGEVLGSASPDETKLSVIHTFPIFMGTLPYKLVARRASLSSLPASDAPKVTIRLHDSFNEFLSYTMSIPEVTGKRINLSFEPATFTDGEIIASYGSLANTPAYLVYMSPNLKIEGQVVVKGNSVGLAQSLTLGVSFSVPNLSSDKVTNNITVGDIVAIVLDGNVATVENAGKHMSGLRQNVATEELQELIERFLYGIGSNYFLALETEEFLYAKNFQMVISKEPTAGFVSYVYEPELLYGVSYKVTESGVLIDIDRNIYKPFPLDGSRERKRDFMIVSGLGSSAREHNMIETFLGVPAVSAAKLLRKAHQSGIQVRKVDSSNIDSILPSLSVSEDVIMNIQNAVNAGEIVFVPEQKLQQGDWSGVGYIVLDPSTGAAGYMISGGFSGSFPYFSIPLEQVEALLKRLCSGLRNMVIGNAISLIGTPYTFGCKGLGYAARYGVNYGPCGNELDCSGLIFYVFGSLGFKSIGRIATAQSYFNATKENSTEYPLYGDLFFFQATYDKNEDNVIDDKDGITHVGITVTRGNVIHASSNENGVVLQSAGEIWGKQSFVAFTYPPEYESCETSTNSGVIE